MQLIKFLWRLYVVNYAMKYFFILSLFFPAFLQAQASNEELLEWNGSRKLSWSDYKANPDPESDAAASTTTYLSIEYNMGNNNFGYKIKSRFSKSRSWGVHKTAYILDHEQGHFDIAEIFARKLNKAMTEYRFDRKNFKQDLRKIYQEIIDEKEEMQNEYDEETNHSINKTKQAEWLKKIRKMLEEYEEYANY